MGDRRPLPQKWERYLTRTHVHVIDIIVPAGRDEAAQSVDGLRLEQQPCLIEPERQRTPTQGSLDVTPRYSLTVHRDLPIEVGTRVEQGRTREGDLLLPQGVVVAVTPQTHQDYGVLALVATVARN